jgi:hypothetical protein
MTTEIVFTELERGTRDRTFDDFLGIAGLMSMAETELAAFTGVVTDLFGSEQAQQSAEDWVEEFELMEWPDDEAIPEWRSVTIAASARLAGRVGVHAAAA